MPSQGDFQVGRAFGEQRNDRASFGHFAVSEVLAFFAFYAYNAYNKCVQYTIRKVPNPLDAALRRRAREQGKSLNEVAIEALARGAGLSEGRCRQRDLTDIAGSWQKDPAFDSALAAQDMIDPELWR